MEFQVSFVLYFAWWTPVTRGWRKCQVGKTARLKARFVERSRGCVRGCRSQFRCLEAHRERPWTTLRGSDQAVSESVTNDVGDDVRPSESPLVCGMMRLVTAPRLVRAWCVLPILDLI